MSPRPFESCADSLALGCGCLIVLGLAASFVIGLITVGNLILQALLS